MRRTITTLMFLAVGGLAYAAHAADNGGNANWQYYAAGASSYRISDDDDGPATAGKSGVANASGSAQQPGQEQNALYVAENGGLSGEVLQTSFFDHGGCNSCGSNNCSCLSDCCNCDCSTTMARLEWLGWFSRGRNTPPLVTTSPPGTALANAGVLPTQVLYGDDPIGTNLRNGGRFTLSRLLGDNQTTATFRFWGVEDSSATFAANSGQFPILGIPFRQQAGNINQEAAFLAAFPGLNTGSVRVLSKNDLIGLDAWGSRNWFNDGSLSIDVLAGYQLTRLDDSLQLSTLSTALVSQGGGAINPGDQLGVFDSFRTKNEFNGATLGLQARSYRGPITLEGLFKMGLGNMHQTVTVNGNTTLNGVPLVPASGIFAQPTNIGTQTHDHFAYVPELNANLLYNINSNWRAMVGYSFIYWNNVVLAGNQMDRNLNFPFNNLPPSVPAPKFQRTDFWVQGISLGADYRW